MREAARELHAEGIGSRILNVTSYEALWRDWDAYANDAAAWQDATRSYYLHDLFDEAALNAPLIIVGDHVPSVAEWLPTALMRVRGHRFLGPRKNGEAGDLASIDHLHGMAVRRHRPGRTRWPGAMTPGPNWRRTRRMPPILVLSDLAFAYGERVLFEGLSIALEPGDKIGLIGDNGVGKSSLIKLILGQEKPLRGEIALRNGVRVGRARTGARSLRPSAPCATCSRKGFGPLIGAIDAWEKAIGEMSPKADALMTQIENLGGFDYEHRISDIADALDLPPLDRTIGTLSGGQGKRVAMGRLVLSNPDVVLLDEPTNHLDIETVEWLEKWIAESPASCLVVTHDRAFLDGAVTKMAELRSTRRMSGPDAARGPLAVYAGNYEDYLEARAVEEDQRAALGQSRAQQLKGELEWSRRQPKARTVKSAARMGRVEALKGEVRDLKARRACRLRLRRRARRAWRETWCGSRARRSAMAIRRPSSRWRRSWTSRWCAASGSASSAATASARRRS